MLKAHPELRVSPAVTPIDPAFYPSSVFIRPVRRLVSNDIFPILHSSSDLYNGQELMFYTQVHKSRQPGRCGHQIPCGCAQYVWTLSLQLALHQPPGAQKF